jgi:hypothetical protein
MDLSRLSTAHKIAIGGALVLLIDSFLNWYSVSAFGVSIGINAWDSGLLAWGGVIAGVAAGVILALKATGKQDVKAGGKSAEQIAMILGIVSVVLVLLRLVTETSYMAFGLFLGVIAAAAVAYGAWMASKGAATVTTSPMSTPTPPAP